MSVGRLHLCVVEAELRTLDTEEEKNFNPYCLVSVGGEKDKQRVNGVGATLRPVWNHNLLLKINTAERPICLLAVWNQFRYWTDEILGCVCIKLDKYRDGLPKERWFQLCSVQEYEQIQVQLGESSLLGSLGLGKDKDPTKYTMSRGRIRLKIMFEATEMFYISPLPLTRKQQLRQAAYEAKGKDFIPDASSSEEEQEQEEQERHSLSSSSPSASLSGVVVGGGKSSAKSVTIHSKSIEVISDNNNNTATEDTSNNSDTSTTLTTTAPLQTTTTTTTVLTHTATPANTTETDSKPRVLKPITKKKITKREADIQEGEKKAIPVMERADDMVKVPFPWGYVITSENMCISVDGDEAVAAKKFHKEMEVEKANTQLLLSQYQEKIKDKVSQLRLMKAEFKKMQQGQQELAEELAKTKLEVEAGYGREAELKQQLETSAQLVGSVREELAQAKRLEKTLLDVENEKVRLKTQLNTKETSLAKSQEEAKRLKTEQIAVQKTGFEARIKGLFKLDKEETLLNQHPCATGIIYVFVNSLCIDIYIPTENDNVSQHKRLAIPYDCIKGIKRRTFIKFVKGEPGGLSILFGSGKPPIKLDGFVDREACARDIVSMCGTKGFQVLLI